MRRAVLPILLFAITPAVRSAAQTSTPLTEDTASRTRRLAEVTVKARRAEIYSQDSAWRVAPYRRLMQDADRRVGDTLSPNALLQPTYTVTGAISETLLRLSGKKKKLEAFAAEVRADEAVRAARMYYTLDDVRTATGLDSADAALFDRAHPVPLGLASTAPRLEVLMWIRRTYAAEAAVAKE